MRGKPTTNVIYALIGKSSIFALINLNLKLMNDISKEINRIIDTVIDCSKAAIGNDHTSVTRDEVIGRSKKENAVRVRCLVAHFLYKHGLSITTIGMLLGKSTQAVRNKLGMHDNFMRESQIYRIVHAQIERTLKANAVDYGKS